MSPAALEAEHSAPLPEAEARASSTCCALQTSTTSTRRASGGARVLAVLDEAHG